MPCATSAAHARLRVVTFINLQANSMHALTVQLVVSCVRVGYVFQRVLVTIAVIISHVNPPSDKEMSMICSSSFGILLIFI